jgi:uncharacterized protein YsxB (DUF464 family)
MTTVRLFYAGERIIAVEAKGHTGFDQSGRDIVCAAVSAIVQTALLALDKVAHAATEKTEREGYLRCKITSSDSKTLDTSDIILKAMKVGLQDISSGYPSYIKLEETKNVY